SEALLSHGCDRLLAEPRDLCIDALRGEFVEVTFEEPLEILADVRMQHADGAKSTCLARHVEAMTAEPAGHARAMHRPRAPRCHQREARWCISSLDRDVLDCVQQVLLEHPDDAGRRFLDRHPEPPRHARLNRGAGLLQIEPKSSPGVGPRLQAPENELSVSDGWLRAAAPVAGGTGVGAGTGGPHV